ncbi:DNA repair protein rad2 [Umbelopsis nana]
MGVKNLWDILSPVARPVQLDSLRQRKLAIDASIWLYHFLKAVRDKEGNALKNAHIVGFFRRICKLLYYNIKPRERRRRRSEKTKDLKKTAEKILETQLKFQAINEHERRANAAIASGDVKDVMSGNYTYLDELQAAAAKSRKFRKDPYELPEDSDEIKKAKEKLDPRFATDEELRDFIMEFKPSDLDVDSEMFRALPTELQYEIIQDLKLKSRQTSWARLDEMIRKSRTSLDFSKQQIQHLMHRNVMTQRLLDVNSAVGNETKVQPIRIAGERGRQYVLVKNEDVSEGLGWKLPGLHNGKGTEEKPLLEEDIQEDDESDEKESNHDSKDKVLQAIESNPALQRLLKSMGDSDKVDSDRNSDGNQEDIMDEDELFVQSRPDHETSVQDSSVQADILDNMNAYVDDAMSIQDIMARFQSKQDLDERLKLQHQPTVEPPLPIQETSVIDNMSGPELVNYWINNCPDAFVYEYSLNDEYNNIIKDVVYNLSVDDIQSKITATTRKLGKLTSHDELRNESMSFYKTMLEETCKWKQLQIELLEQFESDKQQVQPQASSHDGKMAWVDSDDEFEALDYSLLEEPTEPPLNIGLSHQRQTEELDSPKNLMKIDGTENSISSRTVRSPRNGEVEVDIPLQHSSLLMSRVHKTNGHQNTLADINNTFNDRVAADNGVVEVHNITDNEESEDDQWQTVNINEHPKGYKSQAHDVVDDHPFDDDNAYEDDDWQSVTMEAQPKEDNAENLDAVEVKKFGCDAASSDDLRQAISTEDHSKENEMFHRASDLVSPTFQSNIFGSDSVSEIHTELPTTDQNGTLFTERKHQPQNIELETIPLSTENDKLDASLVPEQAHAPFSDMTLTEGHTEDTEDTTVANDIIPSEEAPVELEGYDSDVELGSNFDAEDSEYARFVAEFGARDYSDVRHEINEELIALGKDQRRQKRDMDELTTQMIEDAQELLRLFGIPYIISPMEAEAQCAELVKLSLVDGVVTDDSDVFLFGASKVYKNVFNQEKYVECYMSNDVERELSLDRERLIQLAYLLGSDYTTGFAGVGQVAAMEILKEFQGDLDETDESPLKPLQRFKDWWETPTLPKNEISDFRKRFRKRHKDMDIPPDFPNPYVRDAYLSPHVDSSTQEFEWGMPDLDGLRQYLFSMLGWDEKKVDGLVVPVIKEMNSRKAAAQASIGHFFDISVDRPVQQPSRNRTYKSKRMQNVVQSLKQQDKGSKKRSAHSDGQDKTESRPTKRK